MISWGTQNCLECQGYLKEFGLVHDLELKLQDADQVLGGYSPPVFLSFCFSQFPQNSPFSDHLPNQFLTDSIQLAPRPFSLFFIYSQSTSTPRAGAAFVRRLALAPSCMNLLWLSKAPWYFFKSALVSRCQLFCPDNHPLICWWQSCQTTSEWTVTA